jgi:hypothetical protein
MLISLRISQAMKIGELIYATDETEAASFIADGALELDGSVVTSANYPYLALARPSWVAAGNITLPNMANRVLRVKGSDTGDAGTLQEDQMQGHYHNPLSPNTVHLQGRASGGTGYANAGGGIFNPATTGEPVTDGTNGTPRTGTETRSKAFIVRAFVIADGYFD